MWKETDLSLECFRLLNKSGLWQEIPNLPALIRPSAISDWIEHNGRFRMKNIAYWGHTLQRILHNKEYLKVLAQAQPEYFLVKGD